MKVWALLLPILAAGGGFAVGLLWGLILGERRGKAQAQAELYRQWRGRRP